MAPKVGEKAVKAPAKKAPAAKKVVKKTTGAGKKKSKSVESYKIYIYKVLKQVSRAFCALPYRCLLHPSVRQMKFWAWVWLSEHCSIDWRHARFKAA